MYTVCEKIDRLKCLSTLYKHRKPIRASVLSVSCLTTHIVTPNSYPQKEISVSRSHNHVQKQRKTSKNTGTHPKSRRGEWQNAPDTHRKDRKKGKKGNKEGKIRGIHSPTNPITGTERRGAGHRETGCTCRHG